MIKTWNLLIMLILLGLLTCSCSTHNLSLADKSDEFPITQTQPAQTIPTTEAVEPSETAPATEPPEETAPPLGMPAGSYLDSYTDEETGDYLDFYIHFPENAVEGMPLLVFLHGDGEVGNPYVLKNGGIIGKIRKLYGEEFPFISIAPNTRVRSWINGDIPETLKGLIDATVEMYSIDPERIIISGHSRGAIGVWNMISIYGDYFSAAVPIGSPHAKGHINYDNASKVPVWTFAGNIGETENSYHKYLEYNVEQINNRGGSAKFTILEGYNHGGAKSGAITQDTVIWMLWP